MFCNATWFEGRERRACSSQALPHREFCEKHDPHIQAEKDAELRASRDDLVEAALRLDDVWSSANELGMSYPPVVAKAQDEVRFAAKAYRAAKESA